MPKDQRDYFKVKNCWSEIKDRLLAGYLPQYFQKLLASRRPIYYIDCFAGKGKFEDGKDGSPIIALNIRDEKMKATKVKNAGISMCFIELNHAQDLLRNISVFKRHGIPDVISGRYEDHIERLLYDKQGYNVFLYIDPYGIRALDYELLCNFAKYGFSSIELLINMNTFGFFRDACRVMRVEKVVRDEAFLDLDDLIVEYEPTKVDISEQSDTLLTRIAGGDYWKAIVTDYNNGMLDGYTAEKRFSYEYKQQLRRLFTYVLDMPIRMKPEHRPKYRMIHACNHADGCRLMADNMANRKDELFIDIQNQGQLGLFNQTIENEDITQSDLYSKMDKFLEEQQEEIRLNVLLASFFTKHGVVCKSGELCRVLQKMEDTNRIVVTRRPSHTPTGKPSRFFTEEKGQSVTIRRA